jgi:hypothetical protein
LGSRMSAVISIWWRLGWVIASVLLWIYTCTPFFVHTHVSCITPIHVKGTWLTFLLGFLPHWGYYATPSASLDFQCGTISV